MKIFRVFQCDEDGRDAGAILILYALSIKDARAKASERLKNKEIITTGYYNARELSPESVRIQIAGLEDQLRKLKNIK